jgi:tetratricopeptide (TPR) repeat protein
VGALAAIQEADIRRELAAARPDLGRALFKLSNWLADLGEREKALAAIQEAAGIRRELAAARPDTFRPDLGRALFNLSLRLADLGRREEALAAIQEATSIYRELAAARPDAYQRALEKSLQVAAWLEHGEDHNDAARREPRA